MKGETDCGPTGKTHAAIMTVSKVKETLLNRFHVHDSECIVDEGGGEAVTLNGESLR